MAAQTDPQTTARLKRIGRAVTLSVFLGCVACVLLQLRGIRYFGPLPTVLLVWVPMLGGMAVHNRVAKASRGRWIGWGVGVLAMIAATVELIVDP